MYSKWNKVDLHIHTDKSKETKENDYNGEFSVDVLCEKLNDNNVKMISLTDHNIINCEAYNELGSKELDFLVGVELDVAITEENLIEYVEMLNGNSLEKVKVKPFHALILFRSTDFNHISEQLENMYVEISKNVFRNEINMSTSKKLRVTTIDYIVRSFFKEDYFIIAHGNKDKGIVEPFAKTSSISKAQNEILIGGISALEMKSNSNLENVINMYNENFAKLMQDDFKTTKTTSYVVFSDNHNCNEYELRSKATWIKGKPTYETLRIAFSDPESRIHTSENEPRLNTNYIETINLCINEQEPQEIFFSPQLNVIIGGRSSGKSLLFNTLVKINNEFTEDDKKVFKNYKDIVDIEKTTSKLSIGNFDGTISIPGEAFYQESIIRLFEEDNDLKAKLESEFTEINDSDIRRIENELDDVVEEFNKAYKAYYDVSSRIDKGDVSEHIKIVIQNSERLFDIDFSKLVKTNNIKELDSVIEELSKIIDLNKEIKSKKIDNMSIFDDEEQTKIDEFVSLFEKKTNELSGIKKKQVFYFKYIDEVKKINRNYVESELTSEKQRIEQTKQKLEDDLDDYKTYFISKRRLKKSCEKIEELDKKIDDKINIKSKYKFVTKVNLNISGNAIIENFFKEKVISYNVSMSLYKNMLNLANLELTGVRLKQYVDDGKKPDKLKTVFLEYIKNIKSKKTYEIIECAENGHEISTLSTSQGKKASIFLDIKLKNLIEDHNKYVLFIDQLEDNIDNKFISEELVKIIRKLKNKIQIILVTHNPSIAIYGDAENIVIAENVGNKFRYKQGGLEDIGIREDACKILDGGEVAFKNRMDKYNIDILEEVTG